MVPISNNLLYQTHRYVLNNTEEVQTYINEHMDYIRRINQVNQRRRSG